MESKINMFYGASPEIFQRAEELRKNMTRAEEILWDVIRINEWHLKFRRQHPIAKYIADFYCHKLKLVIELDGGIHDTEEGKRNDKAREDNLKELGLTVIRFKNEEVINDCNTVMSKITENINSLQSTPSGNGAKENLIIVKIGGNIIDNDDKLSSFLKSFAAVKGRKILVHGGGKLATKLAEQMQVPQQMIDGRRITDAATLKIVTMVYAGYINKNIVAQLQSHGCNAIGLSGTDGNAILAHKRSHPTIDYGFAGDIDAVNSELLTSLLEQELTVVMAPITHDRKGQLLNTNADTIAQELAKALSNSFDVQLVYSFEKSGVLLDINDESSVIKKLTSAEYEVLKTPLPGVGGARIFAGMIPKLDNAFQALNSGVKKVIIGQAEKLQELISGTSGTTIVNE